MNCYRLFAALLLLWSCSSSRIAWNVALLRLRPGWWIFQLDGRPRCVQSPLLPVAGSSWKLPRLRRSQVDCWLVSRPVAFAPSKALCSVDIHYAQHQAPSGSHPVASDLVLESHRRRRSHTAKIARLRWRSSLIICSCFAVARPLGVASPKHVLWYPVVEYTRSIAFAN